MYYMKVWKWYVYILECEDGSYYTGLTSNPINRHDQHFGGLGSAYTIKHKPKEMVYIEEWEDLDAAREREIQIKGWTRMKKEKLISGEWGQI
jgi:putative endonuclease